jgi:CheY-like chemotaxis protein
MRILLVDDNPLMQQVISRFLASQGYEVVIAQDGAEALELARHNRVVLLVIDMRLPDQDGPQVLATLRGVPGLGDCPAIAVSGMGEDDRERTMSAGFDTFLAKPIDLDDLLRSVRRYVEPGAARAAGF